MVCVASMASMATPPDSGDSNLPKEPGNEVCDIINCVAKKVPSTGFKETEVTQSFERYSGMFSFKPYS